MKQAPEQIRSFAILGYIDPGTEDQLTAEYFATEPGSPAEENLQELVNLTGQRGLPRRLFKSRIQGSSDSETDVFTREMESPVMIDEPELGVTYKALLLNRHKPGIPIVAYSGLSLNSEDAKVRTDLRYLTEYTNRPVISLDPIGAGGTSNAEHKADWDIDDLARSNVAALTTLGVEQADVVGYSWGGAVAARVAVQLGAAAHKLVTVSAVSFEYGTNAFVQHVPGEAVFGIRKYAWLAPSWQVRDEIHQGRGAKIESFKDPKKRAALVQNAKILIPPSLAELPNELADTTDWVDIAASGDKLTNWKAHIKAVRERNARLPKSSESLVLGSEGHMWVMNSPAMMHIVATSLDKPTKR